MTGAKIFVKIRCALDIPIYNESFSLCCFHFMISCVTYMGCASKPTPRSEIARVRRSVFKFLDNDEVFFIALIVTMLNKKAVKDKKEFKTQRARNDIVPSRSSSIFRKVNFQINIVIIGL